MNNKILHIVFSKQLILILLFSGISFTCLTAAGGEDVSMSLQKAGFENVKVLEEDTLLCVSYENNIYRWNVRGIVVSLDSIAAHADSTHTVQIVIQSRGIPQVVVVTKLLNWIHFRSKKMTATEYKDLIVISYNVEPTWKKLNKTDTKKKTMGDIDFVVYGQLKLFNTSNDTLYNSQANIAPTVEIYLWKGAKATNQWIFPFVDNPYSFGPEGPFIRPSFTTLSQQFRIFKRMYNDISIGLFDNARAGIDWKSNFHVSSHVSLNGELAFTGLATMDGVTPDSWTFRTWDVFTWSVGGDYYNRRLSTQVAVSAQQFLTGKIGARMDLTKIFDEVAVGFYYAYTENIQSGGIKVTIPLPGSKRTRHGKVRLMLSKYLNWEYAVSSASIGLPAFETRPNENKIEFLFNPVYLKSQLLNY